jgi:ferredoxin
MKQIHPNFEEIKGWFDSDKWDIGYLTKEHLEICSQTPIKNAFNPHGWNFTNNIHFNWWSICNGIVLIKHSVIALDYLLYEEATEILNEQGWKKDIDWTHVYTNFKEALILSGRGLRARNSLVYNYKFGFDTKICVIGFNKIIQNLPKIKRVAGNNFKDEFWHKCIGCDACREVCPVGAIHNNESINWLDGAACDDFLGTSDHPKIPSMKQYWHKNVRPDIPKELVDNVYDPTTSWNANGYTTEDGKFYKDGKIISVPICRECQVQAPCSKWGGIYPYEEEEKTYKLKKN